MGKRHNVTWHEKSYDRRKKVKSKPIGGSYPDKVREDFWRR